MKNKNKQQKKEINILIWLMLLTACIGIIAHHGLYKFTALADNWDRHTYLPKNPDKETLSIQDKIIIAARQAGIDENEALDIAFCESRYTERARSKVSSATGVYQFIARTWFDYCEGDPKDADHNIKCFMKLYPKFPQWWECAKLLGL
jgi:hypothetical protein